MTRLNARLDADLANKLELLKQRTRKTTSEIIRESIELYYRQTERGGGASIAAAFEGAGFVGCADGEENLSESYKDQLAELIQRKGEPG